MNKTLRQFLDSLTDWVWEMDVNGIHTYSNDAVEEILGYKPEELIGRHVSMFWPVESATPEHVKIFNRELKDGEAWQHYRGRFRHKDGQLKILESSGEPLFDGDGKLVGFRGIDRDIEQTLKYEQELEDSRQEYQELSEKLAWENEFKTLLLDIISHDILNPMNVISGFSEMLSEEQPGNEKIAAIHSSSHRLMGVIANAHALTQISLGESVELTPTRLEPLILQATTEFEAILHSKNIALVMNIPEDIIVPANPILVEVFKNYISNALKYAQGTQVLTICAKVEENHILVEVQDEGATLATEVQVKIFERGVQLNKQHGGGGLGLAIVRRIARAHGATVGVRALQPRGNAFFLRLPQSG